jgi:hypothetical protein
MMAALSSAPQSLQALAEQLAINGTPLGVHAFDSPGNQQLRAQTLHGIVQATADRGEWFVELAPPGSSEFFDAAGWRACLTRTDVSLELIPLDAQTAWLADLLVADVPTGDTIECLREARRTRAYGRMGLRP